MRKLRSVLLYASAGALAACQQVPEASSEQGAPVAPVARAAAAPAPTPAQAQAPMTSAAPAPVLPAGPVSHAMQQQAHRVALGVLNLLEAGREDEARAELDRALAIDPQAKLALHLQRQLTADPEATLGRESFSYTVRPNETLSMIAGRFLGDIYSFYILARYNGISVPRQVAGGQVLRIPGKAPSATAREPSPSPATTARPGSRGEPAVAVPAPATVPAAAAPAAAAAEEPSAAERAMRSAEAAERGGNLELAYAEYRKAASLNESGAVLKVEELRKQLVQRYSVNARTAFARQDLDGAIRAWDRVLDVDPGNDTARLERQRALTLKDKAKKL